MKRVFLMLMAVVMLMACSLSEKVVQTTIALTEEAKPTEMPLPTNMPEPTATLWTTNPPKPTSTDIPIPTATNTPDLATQGASGDLFIDTLEESILDNAQYLDEPLKSSLIRVAYDEKEDLVMIAASGEEYEK